MAHEPLSTPRRDPTACDAIARAEPRQQRPRTPSEQPTIRYVSRPVARKTVETVREGRTEDERETLYLLFRLFHYYTHGIREMPETHKAFLVGVRENLKAAGYRTRDPAKGDPLGGEQ